jgi:hypothetical protein
MGRGISVAAALTIDEELNLLHEQLRRLKIEYEIFFNNPTKRPPADVEWRVTNLIRKFSDGTRMNFAQRYRYNQMAQQYAIQSDLWRKKTRIREEGYRRPQDAVLAVQGAGGRAERENARPVYGVGNGAKNTADEPFSIQCSDGEGDREKIESLYKALNTAKQTSGEQAGGSFDSFAAFVKKKTKEIRKQHGCESVVYSVEMQDGRAKLKAKAKK